MSVAQLRKLTLKQLDDLIIKAQAVRSEKIPEERSKTKAELAQAARAKGFSLEELFGSGRRSFKRPGSPKWRNPSDPAQTWSGRGRKPHWFNEKTAVAV